MGTGSVPYTRSPGWTSAAARCVTCRSKLGPCRRIHCRAPGWRLTNQVVTGSSAQQLFQLGFAGHALALECLQARHRHLGHAHGARCLHRPPEQQAGAGAALTPLSLAGALAIGVAFGFVLERTGFGRAQILVAQFYGTRMTVYRAMFTAVVTAAVGSTLLAALGVLDLKAVTINYPTYLWPMVLGGVLVGAGFVISGYCPGTSVVAAASGKLDGAVTVLGTVLGALAYAEVQPAVAAFHDSGKLGSVFLYDLLGVPPLALALVVAVVAVLTFKGAARIEALVARSRAAAPSPATDP